MTRVPFTRVEILGFSYSLKPVDLDAAAAAQAYGWCDTRNEIIRYCPSDSPCRVKDTILHEINHVIHHLAAISDDPGKDELQNISEERRVKILSTMLRKVMLDNPGLARYLFS